MGHSLPSAKLLEETRKYNSIVCSNLKRSIDSANLLELDKNIITDKLFREAELPHWNFSRVKLPPSLWTAISRIVWLLGYSPNCDSISKTKARAAQGAQRLIELAEENCYIMFVGHGFINQYISKKFPKKCAFKTVTDKEIQTVMHRLNNRPRKCLGYLTPHEVFFVESDIALAS